MQNNKKTDLKISNKKQRVEKHSSDDELLP